MFEPEGPVPPVRGVLLKKVCGGSCCLNSEKQQRTLRRIQKTQVISQLTQSNRWGWECVVRPSPVPGVPSTGQPHLPMCSTCSGRAKNSPLGGWRNRRGLTSTLKASQSTHRSEKEKKISQLRVSSQNPQRRKF